MSASEVGHLLPEVQLVRYPAHIHADSLAGQTCRWLAAGATIDQIVDTLEALVPLPKRMDPRWADAYAILDRRMAALAVRYLGQIGVSSPAVTMTEAEAIIAEKPPRCGRPTRSGQPCRHRGYWGGFGCHQHDEAVGS